MHQREGKICERTLVMDTQLPGRAAQSAATALQRCLLVAVGVGQVWGRRASAALRDALQPECTAARSGCYGGERGEDAQFQVSGKQLSGGRV